MNNVKSIHSILRLERGFIWSILLALSVGFSYAEAGSIKLIPDDTITVSGRLNDIPTCGGGNCWVTYATDGVDGTYLSSTSSANQVRWTFSSPSAIPDAATVDSLGLWLRMATSNAGGNDRKLPRMRTAGSGNYCDGANMNIETTIFADSVRRFTTWPTGSATCTGGILSEARLDSLEFQINHSVGDSLKITECSVVVWYHEAGVTKGRRRHLLSDEGGFEKFAEYCHLDPNWVIGFREPEFLWREE